jgi:hypothetical protein
LKTNLARHNSFPPDVTDVDLAWVEDRAAKLTALGLSRVVALDLAARVRSVHIVNDAIEKAVQCQDEQRVQRQDNQRRTHAEARATLTAHGETGQRPTLKANTLAAGLAKLLNKEPIKK